MGLLLARQATATSPANKGGARLPGANKFEPGQELSGSYSKPWLDESTVGAVDAALLDVFPTVPSKSELWEPGLLPLNCAKYHATFPSLSPGFNFSVYNVTYNDCDSPWVFCRHADAHRSIEDMTDMFGRLPIRMRELIRTVVAIPDAAPEDDGWDALSTESDIVVRPTGWELRVLAHEASHILDSHYADRTSRPHYNGPQAAPVGGGGIRRWLRRHTRDWLGLRKLGGGGTLYSATARWREAEQRDAAVVTSYSLTSWVEHFAEMAGPGLLEAARGPGAVAALVGRDVAEKLRSQIAVWAQDWGFVASGGGLKCDERERPDPAEVIHNDFF
ncbi:hypothetical protein MAPG_06299 [Magnaporthiopsis poae ATCC 64411]|uniref:Uncharacterized protein n=1 Tax=Magnaporthiopsis poae (strain ATCC 64411 / 73-15) TaxID=644358 RepID=A0A0C4E1N4_MAGP6|nr:hypothetical protein MAPG_06299 [Magnaporthiopsis poae ATCC 64411]